jgi:hypothetical protein
VTRDPTVAEQSTTPKIETVRNHPPLDEGIPALVRISDIARRRPLPKVAISG